MLTSKELTDALRRTETLVKSLRRDNGDLRVALMEHAPEVHEALTPITDWPTRFVVLDRIVEAATDLVAGFSDSKLASLSEAVAVNEGYWSLVDAERVNRRVVAARGAETRRVKREAGVAG